MRLNMPKISYFGLIWAFLFVSAGVANAFDDAAVAVCEYTQFRGQDLAERGYERTSADIFGTHVQLNYKRSVLNTQPTVNRVDCYFVRNILGEFILAQPFNLDPQRAEAVKCRDTVAKGEERLRKDDLDVAEAGQVRTAISMCDRALGRTPALVEVMKEIGGELFGLGIYPISPADTQLR